MTPLPRSSLALIIDHDLGFLMWLGDLLAELGYQAAPALNCRQAMAMVKRSNLPVSTVIVDPALRGARQMLARLAAANPGLRVILIRDSAGSPDGKGNPPGINVQGTLERPSPWEPISRPEWLARVRKLLFLAATTS